MDLIPKLPNDIALECLIRVPYHEFGRVGSVCKEWKRQIEQPEFRRLRRTTNHSQRVLIMSQARVDPNMKTGGTKRFTCPEYRVTLLELDTGRWSELPPIPEYSNGLPLLCHLAAVGSDVVLMGGLDPVTWAMSNSVFVYSLVNGTWRRGADMPGVRRSFYGCASDHDRTVYVACGHDEEKNALRSALAYDVARDEWRRMPDMAKERDECKGIFYGGQFYAVGGYCTERQGRFEESAEGFDVVTWQWGDVRESFLEEGATCPKTCTAGEGVVYMSVEGDVVAWRGDKWQPVAKLPGEVSNVSYMSTWEGKLVGIGRGGFTQPHVVHVFELKSSKWIKMESREEEFSGHVHTGCYLEI